MQNSLDSSFPPSEKRNYYCSLPAFPLDCVCPPGGLGQWHRREQGLSQVPAGGSWTLSLLAEQELGKAAPGCESSQRTLQRAASFICVIITSQTDLADPQHHCPGRNIKVIIEIMIEKQVIIFQWV